MAFYLSPVVLSIKITLLATAVVMTVGTALAWVMHRFRFPGYNLLETVIGLPLVLPPTVIGFCLLFLFGRHGPLGFLLENLLHFRVVFTWWAAVIAAAVVSLPLMYRSARAGFASVDNNLEQAARTLGASEWKVFHTVTLPLCRPGIMAGVLLAFTRALGEFGATVMLAGNIPGQTQTIPLAIFFAAESGDMATAGWLVGVITLASFVITYGINRWNGMKGFIQPRQRGVQDAGSGYQKSSARF